MADVYENTMNVCLVNMSRRLHTKCRGEIYPRSEIKRYPVPDEKVNWSVDWLTYDPPCYSSHVLQGKSWADPEISSTFFLKFNRIDGIINRVSYTGSYKIQENYPLNPGGRTGIKERGLLGRWGPNHAADLVLTRWLRDESGNKIVNDDTNKPILQFIGIERMHGCEWAIPGGMVDPGENSLQAAAREFLEETMGSENIISEEAESLKQHMDEALSGGETIYQGYVDDPRNTDNAWLETSAVNFHSDGAKFDHWKFRAGSDAKNVAWLQISSSLKLYASHIDIIQLVASRHQAHW